MKRMIVAGIACIAVVAEAVHGDVVVENAKFRLVIGADAVAQSLRIKATGEELLDNGERLPLFSATQDRPFDNELKLASGQPCPETGRHACGRVRAGVL